MASGERLNRLLLSSFLINAIFVSFVGAGSFFTKTRIKPGFIAPLPKPSALEYRVPGVRSISAFSMTNSVPRGGASASRASKSDDKDDKQAKIAYDALSSIRFCYRAFFAGFLADIVETLLEYDTISKRAFTWVEAVDMFDSLNLLTFGLGLWKVSRVYNADFKSDKAMSAETVQDLCSTMAALWRNTAWVMVGIAMVTSASITEYLPFVPGPYVLPTGVFAIAMAESLVLRNVCLDDAAKVVETERNSVVKPGYEKARMTGFIASRNMRLCTGSFSLMATAQFVSWLLKPADLIGRISSVFDFVTPATIAGLLLTLYNSYLRAIVNATGGRSVDAEEYTDLLVAQKGFYTKVANTVAYGAFFKLLPYAIAYVKPYLIAAVQVVAPSFAEEL